VGRAAVRVSAGDVLRPVTTAYQGPGDTGFTGKHFAAGKEKPAMLAFIYLGRKVYLALKIYR
jgi:hypothetical protein